VAAAATGATLIGKLFEGAAKATGVRFGCAALGTTAVAAVGIVICAASALPNVGMRAGIEGGGVAAIGSLGKQNFAKPC